MDFPLTNPPAIGDPPLMEALLGFPTAAVVGSASSAASASTGVSWKARGEAVQRWLVKAGDHML